MQRTGSTLPLGILFLLLTGTIPAWAQEQTLIVQETKAASIVVHPDFPGAASILLHAPFGNMHIESSAPHLNQSYDNERAEYILTIEPKTAYTLTLCYPGLLPYELFIPPLPGGTSRAYTVAMPASLSGEGFIIETTPQDAIVEVDGIEVGRSNLHAQVPAGPHVVRITKSGYNAIEFRSTVRSGEYNMQKLTLTRADVPVTITSNVINAAIYVDDMLIGYTPVTSYLLPQGAHQVYIKSPGYHSFKDMVDVRSDLQNTYHAELETYIDLVPSKSIYVENERISIQDGMLVVEYDLSSEKKKYRVHATMQRAGTIPVHLGSMRGALGNKVSSGTNKRIYWSLEDLESMEDLHVQIYAQPRNNAGWLVGGGIGVGGGLALAILSLAVDQASSTPVSASLQDGGGDGDGRNRRR